MIRSLYHLKERINTIKSNSNFRNGILFTFFSFLNNGVNFFLIMILARYLSPDGYGKLNLFNTSIIILPVLLSLGCTGYIGTTYFRNKKGEFRKVLSIVLYISTIMLLLIGILFTLFSVPIEQKLGLPIQFQYYALLISFFQLFTTINLEIWRIEELPIKYGIYSFGVVFLNFICTMYFVSKLNLDWESRIYAQLIIGLLFFIVSAIFLFKRKLLVFSKISVSLFKETLAFGIPLIPHLLSGWMRQGLDRYFISIMCGINFVGLFSFALNFGNIINMVGVAFNASNSIFIYKSLATNTSDTRTKLAKLTIIMTGFYILLSFFIFAASYILIPYLFPKYIDARLFLFPLCLSATFQCIYYLFVNYIFYFKKTKTLMLITTSISLMHLGLSMYITKYGTIYTAYISLFSSFAICLLVLLFSQKYYPLFRNYNKI